MFLLLFGFIYSPFISYVAFPMAALAGDVIKKGAAREEEMRRTVQPMANLLRAEVGPPAGRRFAVLVAGPLSAVELRLVRRLKSNAEAITFAPVAHDVRVPAELESLARRTRPTPLLKARTPSLCLARPLAWTSISQCC